jgi:hypothetical protein
MHKTEQYIRGSCGVVVTCVCDDCGESLSMGRSNDKSRAVRIEMRAASLIVVSGKYAGRVARRKLTIAERRAQIANSLMYGGRSTHLEMPRRGLAGWLAFEIAMHSEAQQECVLEELDHHKLEDLGVEERAGRISEQGRHDVAAAVARHANIEEGTSKNSCLVCGSTGGCEKHRLFTCAGCQQLTSWEDCGEDEHPNLCSDCWLSKRGFAAVEVITGVEPELGVEIALAVEFGDPFDGDVRTAWNADLDAMESAVTSGAPVEDHCDEETCRCGLTLGEHAPEGVPAPVPMGCRRHEGSDGSTDQPLISQSVQP